MINTLFSDDTNRKLLATAGVAASGGMVVEDKRIETLGTVIGTVAYALTMAKDQGLVKNDHPVLSPHLTPRQAAQKATVLSIETMQSRLSTMQMALEEYQSGFQTTHAVANALSDQYDQFLKLANELIHLVSATKEFFELNNERIEELEQCRLLLNQSFPHSLSPNLLESSLSHLTPVCSAFQSISASMQNASPLAATANTTLASSAVEQLLPSVASTSASIPISCYQNELKTGLAAYTCLSVWSKLNYFRETGWNRERAVNFTFEAARAAADVSSSIGYPLHPLANLAITVGVYGSRLFVDREKTELERLNEKANDLKGKTNRELFDVSKNYIASIAQIEIELLKKLKKKQEEEGATTTPEYVKLLQNISLLTKAVRFGESKFNAKKSLAVAKNNLNKLIEMNKEMLVSAQKTEEPTALSQEFKSLKLMHDSLTNFKKALSTAKTQ